MNLEKLHACDESIEWYEAQESDEHAWSNCERGDWLLWLLGRIGVDRKRLVLCCCECARLSLKYVPEGEDRPRIAIDTAERWAKGEWHHIKEPDFVPYENWKDIPRDKLDSRLILRNNINCPDTIKAFYENGVHVTNGSSSRSISWHLFMGDYTWADGSPCGKLVKNNY